jgi:hypothetical protein
MQRLSWVGGNGRKLAVRGAALAHAPSPVSIEIIDANGRVFHEFPVDARDDALRSYLQAEKGARYQVRVRNTTGERLGSSSQSTAATSSAERRSELARSEPMYVLDAWGTQDYAGWRANLDAVNEFYFTDWRDSYAEAFGDRSARGVIAVAVYREVQPPRPVYQPYEEGERSADSATEPLPVPPPSARADSATEKSAGRRSESAGTGYGERRVDHAEQVEFVASSSADSRHFIKYEWRDTLCRKRVIECGEPNRFWDESVLGFAPPPPGKH